MPGELLEESWVLFMVGIRSLGGPRAAARLGLSQSSQGCESQVSPAGGSSRTEPRTRSEERDVGGRVGSQAPSVLPVQCYPLLLGFHRECTFAVNIFGNQPGKELLHVNPC